jgi:hypothetical protein
MKSCSLTCILFAHAHSPPVAQLPRKLITAKISDILVNLIRLPRFFGFCSEVLALSFGPPASFRHTYCRQDNDDKEQNRSTDGRECRHFTAGSFFAAPTLKPRRLIAFRM